MQRAIPGRLASLGLVLALAACGGAQTRPADGGEAAESGAQDTKSALIGVGADIGCGIANLIRKDCAKGAEIGARVVEKAVSWVFRSLKILDARAVNREYEAKKLEVARDKVEAKDFSSRVDTADEAGAASGAASTAAQATRIKVTSNTDLVGYGDNVPQVTQRYALYDERNKLVSTQSEKLTAVDGAGRYQTEAEIKVPKARGKKKYHVETTLIVDGKEYRKNSYKLSFDEAGRLYFAASDRTGWAAGA